MYKLFLRSLPLASLAFFALFASPVVSQTASSCPLQLLQPYKVPNNPAVYYISEDCKKRPIRSAAVYFSHFISWKDVRVVSPQVLARIPDHELSFLPWGTRRHYENGSLLKTVFDPKVYLLLDNTSLYPIEDEKVFMNILGFSFTQLDAVTPEVIQLFDLKPSIKDVSSIPPHLLFKYPDDPKVYSLESATSTTSTVSRSLEKRHVNSIEELVQMYRFRLDRIATFSKTTTFNDARGAVQLPSPSPAPNPPSQSGNSSSGSTGSGTTSPSPRPPVSPPPASPNPPPPAPTAPTPPAASPTSPPPASPPPQVSLPPSGSLLNYRSAIGSNMHSLIDFGANWIFVDLFKSSRPWASGNSNGDCWDNCGIALDLDANGWVRSLQTSRAGGHVVRAAIMTNVTGGTAASNYPTGRYTVFYDGEGTVSYSGGTRNASLSSAGHDVIDVTNSGVDTSLILEIRATNPSNYIRNIRVYPPGGSCSNDQTQYCTTNSQCGGGNTCRIFADTPDPQLLHPTYLRNNRSTGVVRFMQEWGINEVGIENVRNPSDINALSSAQWFRTPPEVIGQIGNALQSDVWINIPVNASDALIRDVAIRLRSTLNTNSRVFVEYSNESWNGAYPYILQQQILAARGCQNNSDLQAECDQDATPGNGIYCEGHPWPLRYIPACGTGEMREFSTRSVQVGQIFRDVFGANGRVVRVMGSFTGSTWRTGNLLSWRNAYQNIDAVATAPYFGNSISGDARAQTMNLTQLFDYLQTVSLPAAFQEITDDTAYLRQNYPSIDLIAYEGGQHLVAYGANEGNIAAQTLFRNANNDSRMGGLYTQYLQGWRDRGGKTFAHFVDVTPQTRYGNFGALLSQNQPHNEAPKFLALENFALETACWWTGCEFGGSWLGRGGTSSPSPSPSPTPPTPSPASPSPSPNPPPTVSLTSPTNNATFTAPASVTITATAADSNGSVSQVQFYQGSTLIAQDSSSPYSVTWSNVAAGTYSITARATDNAGAQTTSNAISVTVSTGGSSSPPPAPPSSSTGTLVLNVLENVGYGYWAADGYTHRILFSQQSTNPVLYGPGVINYERAPDFNEVYLNRSQLNMLTGTIYLRLCIYNQATDSCTVYSPTVPYNGTN